MKGASRNGGFSLLDKTKSLWYTLIIERRREEREVDVFVEDLAESVKRLTDELAHRVRHEERLRKVIDEKERRINELEAHCVTLNSDISHLESEYDNIKEEGEKLLHSIAKALCSDTEQLLWNGDIIEIYDNATGATRELGKEVE